MIRFPRFVAISCCALSLLLLGGCHSSEPLNLKGPGSGCESTAECAQGLICEDGVCELACSGRDCTKSDGGVTPPDGGVVPPPNTGGAGSGGSDAGGNETGGSETAGAGGASAGSSSMTSAGSPGAETGCRGCTCNPDFSCNDGMLCDAKNLCVGGNWSPLNTSSDSALRWDVGQWR